MTNEFSLSARFCIFNRVCVLSTCENLIEFGMKNTDDFELREKLEKSAMSHFKKFNIKNGKVIFKSVGEEEIRKKVAIGYGRSLNQKFEPNQKLDESSESVTAMLADSILNAAVERGATDVHIEESRVRLRVCGRLFEYCSLSFEKSLELVRRVKALSRLDLLDSRNGQDGQFSFKFSSGSDSRFVSVRVSCVPAVSSSFDSSSNFGSESVVLRILDPFRVPLDLKSLGFNEKQFADLSMLSESDFGLVLICGATGSGKSTTAASILRLIAEKSNGGKKIITIEDPPEYVLDGITQIRVDAKNGMDFSDALRFVFRQDPDVIFVGEIRDEVTARACLRASLTGHFVIATMHTSSFETTLSRLRDLGVSEADVSSSLLGVVMQKLVFDSGIKLDAEIRHVGIQQDRIQHDEFRFHIDRKRQEKRRFKK